MRRTLGASAGLTCVSFFRWRMRLGRLVPSRWRLPECMRRILPLAVTLKRLAAPRCVFSFSFLAMNASILREIPRADQVRPGNDNKNLKPQMLGQSPALHKPLHAATALGLRLRSRGRGLRLAGGLFGREQREQDIRLHAR